MLKKFKDMSKKKKVILIIAAVLIVLIVARIIVVAVSGGSEETVAVEETATIEKQDLTQTLTISGHVESLSKETVSSQVADAKVLQLNVKVGDRVKAGDIIAVIDDTSVQQKLDNAERSLNNNEIKNSMSIASAERNYATSSQTAEVQAGREQTAINDAAVDLNNATAEYNEALADYEWAKAHYDQAKSEYDAEVAKPGVQDLINKRNALKSPYPEAGETTTSKSYTDRLAEYTAEKARLDGQLFDVDARKSILDNAEKLRDEKKATFTTKETAYKSAQSTYTKANETKYDQDITNSNSILDRADTVKTAKLEAEDAKISGEQQVTEAEQLLEQCVVTSPIDGIITSVGVSQGQIYKGTEIAVIQDDSGFRIVANVDQYDIGKIENGMKTVIKTDTTGDKEMSGEIVFVSPTPVGSDSTTTTAASATSTSVEYRVESTLDDPDSLLRIGMTAKIIITLGEAKGAFVVPDNCIQSDEDGKSYIEVKNGEETRRIYVTEGLQSDYYTQIISDEINEGMEVIVPADNMSDDMGGFVMFY